MRRCLLDAALAAALAVTAGADAAEALAGQARGNLAVTVRVIDRCRTTSSGHAVAQDCAGNAVAAVAEEARWAPAAREIAPMPGQRAMPAVATGPAFMTVIY